MSRKQKSAGSKLKEQFAERYVANPGETLILEHACELADLAERLAAEIRKAPLEGRGAAGQVIANPLHKDFRECVGRFSMLVDALRLPDRPAAKMTTTTRAQRAAFMRWHGKAAS